jgi:hypothetical protein
MAYLFLSAIFQPVILEAHLSSFWLRLRRAGMVLERCFIHSHFFHRIARQFCGGNADSKGIFSMPSIIFSPSSKIKK